MPHVIPVPGAFAAGVAIFLIVIWDAFESIILPRRVTRRFRLTRLFYKRKPRRLPLTTTFSVTSSADCTIGRPNK